MHNHQVAKGTYLLLARLPARCHLAIGRLGSFAFPRGWYSYAGSALGPGGLAARLARHQRRDKRLHWHIDYLLAQSVLEKSWQVECPARLECAWAAAISKLPLAEIIVPRFGATDCRCAGHLVYLPQQPPSQQIVHALAQATPTSCAIQENTYV
jgi:Uri superfamily endonuclease